MKKLTVLLVILFFISCEGDSNDGTISKLPAITTEGKNTFGGKIDGVTFLPRRKPCLFCQDILRARYYYLETPYYSQEPGYYLQIYAKNQLTSKSIKLSITALENPLVEGQFYPMVLKENNATDGNFNLSTQTPHPTDPGVYYHTTHNFETTDEYNGILEIIFLDETNNIISGIFYFDAINSVDGNLVEITDGRFDLIFEPYPN